MVARTILPVWSGFVMLASDQGQRKPVENMSLTIDLRVGRVSEFSKGTIESTGTPEQIGWIDHDCRHLSAVGAFDRASGETHAGVCSRQVGNGNRPGLDYYEMVCLPSPRRF